MIGRRFPNRLARQNWGRRARCCGPARETRRRVGRLVECTPLLRVYTAKPSRGFESDPRTKVRTPFAADSTTSSAPSDTTPACCRRLLACLLHCVPPLVAEILRAIAAMIHHKYSPRRRSEFFTDDEIYRRSQTKRLEEPAAGDETASMHGTPRRRGPRSVESGCPRPAAWVQSRQSPAASRPAAARRLMPTSTAAKVPARRSMESGLPISNPQYLLRLN